MDRIRIAYGTEPQQFGHFYPPEEPVSTPIPVVMVVHYSQALALGPLDMAWLAVTVTAGGHVTPLAALFLSVLAGAFVSVVAIVRTRRRIVRNAEPDPIRTRGPVGYAGPGSLGATRSALRQ